jgi:hypothetical protein
MQKKTRMEEVKYGTFHDAVHIKIQHSLGNSQFVLREKFDPQMHVVMDMMELLCQMILKRMMEDFFFSFEHNDRCHQRPSNLTKNISNYHSGTQSRE